MFQMKNDEWEQRPGLMETEEIPRLRLTRQGARSPGILGADPIF